MKKAHFFSIFFLSAGLSFAQKSFDQSTSKLLMEENKNQFPAEVKYKVDLEGTQLFLEKNRFTFVKFSLEDLERIHDSKHHRDEKINSSSKASTNDIIHAHAFRAQFLNSNKAVVLTPEKKSSFYTNYFIGNDQSKWASNVHSYEKVKYNELYPGIDLIAYSQAKQFKYDFVVEAGADPGIIEIQYEGAEQLQIKNNTLIIKTSIGEVVESIPLAFQLINGHPLTIDCKYELIGSNKIKFQFPQGYDKNFPLVIDPVLVAASYSGGTATTYGHSATYDNGGNIYTGGECFSTGYPATVGAFDLTYAGSTDIAVSKLNPDGSNLLWATYLGGSSSEIPNSMYVNNSDEIYVYGASNSTNFPTSTGCYDATSNGGYDIVVTHLNATGSALIGSTYVGGSAGDGYAFISAGLNGHDGMRGEIVVDPANNAWVASYTASTNFPTTAGAYDGTANGAFDACVVRLSPDLSTLQWSTYLGGATDDLGYGLKVNDVGEAYVTGITTSSGFPTTVGSFQPTFQGGASDGYIVKFDAAGSSLMASSFFGSAGGDISYFIYLDKADVPYIYGASNGTMPVTPGVYSNAGAGNFISKLDTNLTSTLISTVVGSAGDYLEAEAFMVDSCDNIYIAGFGSTGTYPVTSDALYPTQASASGGNCYLMVLDKDATTLLYGTFYFGWHVDGGTSRFDPGGSVYLGICMGSPAVACPAWTWDNGLPSAPGWDMFVVKLDFQKTGVNAVAAVSPNDTVCLGTAVNFTNNSNGVTYQWSFGDGSPVSTAVTPPPHIYGTVGTYTVSLIAIDSASCNVVDSTSLLITILPSVSAFAGNDTNVCTGFSVQLNATGGTSYSWSPTTGLSNPNIANPIASPIATTTYVVHISNGACDDYDTITVSSGGPTPLTSDKTICVGDSANLSCTGGVSYVWSPSTGLSNSSIANPLASPATTTIYTVTVTDANGCTNSTTALVNVNPYSSAPFTMAPAPPYYLNSPIYFDDLNTAPNHWYFGDGTTSTDQAPVHIYSVPGTYTVCHVLDATVSSCLDTVCKTFEVVPFDILIPNVVTTNGDGQNEFLEFMYLEYYPNSRIEIYNRWGLKLYENDNYQNNWEGSKYSDGVYYYILYLNNQGNIKSIPGFFHLLREH